MALLLVMVAAPGYTARAEDPVLLLLEVRLDHTVLSGAIPAYDLHGHTYLPMGELARLLTIAIQTQPAEGTASGFVLHQDRSFSLNVADAQVSRAGLLESIDPALIMQEPDDLYVARSLLERWLPVEFAIERSSQVLTVKALEELPLQARLRRERKADRSHNRGGYQAPQYPLLHSPYQMIDTPFIDQTLTADVGERNGQPVSASRYSAHLTGDLLGLESSVFFSADSEGSDPEVRATAGRRDPEGRLLGLMRARSYSFGDLSSPRVANIMKANNGQGVSVSNRSLHQPTQFDSQSFEGDLPPGWDVELYYNNSLVDFQQVGSDGRYRFEDLPLSYGRNDFQLVFNGPLGQTRVENYSYPLDQSMTRPGVFRYDFKGHQDEQGNERFLGQFDLGVLRNLSASAAFMSAPIDGTPTSFTRVGLRTFWQSVSLNGGYTEAENGGHLGELGLQTRMAGISVDASRLYVSDFVSDEFLRRSDPIVTRDELRLTGSFELAPDWHLPVSMEYERDKHDSGLADTRISNRISAYVFRAAMTNRLQWRSVGGDEQALGAFLLSRRLYDVSLRGSINYRLLPFRETSSVALTADYNLAEGYRLNLGVSRDLVNPETRWNIGLSKSIGRFGLGLNGQYSDTGDYSVGLRLSMGLGREPRTSDWIPSARAMAGLGAASVRTFVDENGNGIWDEKEEPVSDAGFVVNGARREFRTDEDGIAQLGRLPVARYVDVAVDRSTLLDPRWEPSVEGVSLVPRPGHVAQVDFPVQVTTEIDGTLSLWEDNTARGIGGIKMELLNVDMTVVGEATTAWDGFYIVPRVPSGEYYLRVSPEQLNELGLRDTGFRVLEVSANEGYISGVDMLVLRPQPETRSTPASGQRPVETEVENAARKENWISRQRPGNFTIQLLSASREITVKAFMRQHGLIEESAYFESRYRGGPWFSVVHGSYGSAEAAQRALDRLPASFKEASPWVRRFRDVHRIMESSLF
ncbi:SPOR domain-containing protein [Marinimicrobium sp. C2-29]|uniref:SPOR domain-containing protein n=1 Tax=Marinimicrobium sp. C2-29 TaxID=3139825 RepID=UPI003139448A